MTDPAADAARARVDTVLESARRIPLQVVVVSAPDAERLDARDRARTAAIVAGRGPLLEEAVAVARDQTMRAFARGGFSGTWAATDMAVSVVSPADRVAAATALEEAVTAAVVEDLVDDETLDLLRSTSDDLARMKGIPSPGSLGSLALPANDISTPTAAIITLVAAAVIVLGAVLVGSVSGGIIALFGLAIIAGIARRRPRSEP
jgi:hypothetical protein